MGWEAIGTAWHTTQHFLWCQGNSSLIVQIVTTPSNCKIVLDLSLQQIQRSFLVNSSELTIYCKTQQQIRAWFVLVQTMVIAAIPFIIYHSLVYIDLHLIEYTVLKCNQTGLPDPRREYEATIKIAGFWDKKANLYISILSQDWRIFDLHLSPCPITMFIGV